MPDVIDMSGVEHHLDFIYGDWGECPLCRGVVNRGDSDEHTCENCNERFVEY